MVVVVVVVVEPCCNYFVPVADCNGTECSTFYVDTQTDLFGSD